MVAITNSTFTILALAAVGLSPATPAFAAPARTDGLPVGKCVNLGNHLEPPIENGWAGKRIEEADLQNIAQAGFDTIRLPVRWSAHAGAAPPYEIDREFLLRVVDIVGWARKAKLNVILNDHHYEDLHKDPAAHRARLAGLWDQIAETFRPMSRDHLWFEIANEPNGKLTHANLLDTLAPSLQAIRRTNPDRPVIIGGENWSGLPSLATLPLPDDPHVVPTFHYYEPFEFTHQGATWVNPAPRKGRKYGTKDDRERLVRDVATLKAYVARTGKVPFMGEFGAHSEAKLADRVKYQKSVRVAFDRLGIGMCAWGYTNTFPLYDHKTGKWIPGMLDAMGVRPKT
jgi:endoglucanase